MPLVRYRSPDDPGFVVFDQSRFRVEHGLFLLEPASIRAGIEVVLREHEGWDLRAMKLLAEDRRLRACLEWLDALPAGDEGGVVAPELVHEPALDRVADALIGRGDFARVECPACPAWYEPGEVRVEGWDYEEEGTTVRGRSVLCGRGHTIYALRDSIDAPGIELEGD